MHDHGGADAGGGGVQLLPLWVQLLWAVALAAVTASHLLTFGLRRGTGRTWSAAHALVGAAMVYMFLPWPDRPVPPSVVVAFFCVLLGGAVVLAGARWVVGQPLQLMNALIALDFAAMAYMFSPMAADLPLVTSALAASYLVLTFGWLRREDMVGTWNRCEPGLRPADPHSLVSLLARLPQVGMNAGMAYMFLAMALQVGEPTERPDGTLVLTVGVLVTLTLLTRRTQRNVRFSSSSQSRV